MPLIVIWTSIDNEKKIIWLSCLVNLAKTMSFMLQYQKISHQADELNVIRENGCLIFKYLVRKCQLIC